MKKITEHNFRTGKHVYKNGEVWEEYDGNVKIGTFANVDGKKVPVSHLVYRLSRRCFVALSDEERQKLKNQIGEYAYNLIEKSGSR